jgi:hypothetical protein
VYNIFIDWEKGEFEPHLTSVNQGTYSPISLHQFLQPTKKGNNMNDTKVNYTPEMVEALHAGYDTEADEATRVAQIVALGDALGRNVASIRAKLTREGLYVKLAAAPAGKAVVRKAALVTAIAAKLDVDEDVVGSLEKATKVALTRVLAAL